MVGVAHARAEICLCAQSTQIGNPGLLPGGHINGNVSDSKMAATGSTSDDTSVMTRSRWTTEMAFAVTPTICSRYPDLLLSRNSGLGGVATPIVDAWVERHGFSRRVPVTFTRHNADGETATVSLSFLLCEGGHFVGCWVFDTPQGRYCVSTVAAAKFLDGLRVTMHRWNGDGVDCLDNLLNCIVMPDRCVLHQTVLESVGIKRLVRTWFYRAQTALQH